VLLLARALVRAGRVEQSRCRRLLAGQGCYVGLAGAGYRRDAVNLSHAVAPKLSVPPSRLTVSRTRITPWPVAVSTHSLPLAPL
jgi:hypothetical protein